MLRSLPRKLGDSTQGLRSGSLLVAITASVRQPHQHQQPPPCVRDVAERGVQGLEAEHLISIGQQWPTAEEFSLLAAAEKELSEADLAQLGVAETFVLAMRRLPRLEQKLAICLFSQQFGAQLEQVQGALALASAACEEVRRSTALRVVLATVLQLGNILNERRQRGKAAAGFELDSLLRLADTRSVDGKTTLLRVLAQLLRGIPLPAAGDAPPTAIGPTEDAAPPPPPAAAHGWTAVELGRALPQLMRGLAHKRPVEELRLELERLQRGSSMAQVRAHQRASHRRIAWPADAPTTAASITPHAVC
eukprot:COSAG01_NODE_4343_length_5118_cov_2.188683_6_plen_306_part_00